MSWAHKRRNVQPLCPALTWPCDSTILILSLACSHDFVDAGGIFPVLSLCGGLSGPWVETVNQAATLLPSGSFPSRGGGFR